MEALINVLIVYFSCGVTITLIMCSYSSIYRFKRRRISQVLLMLVVIPWAWPIVLINDNFS